MISLTLPWPPTVNHYKQVAPPKRSDAALYAARKIKRLPRYTYVTKEGKAYRDQVELIASQLRLNEPLRCKLRAWVIFHPPDRRVRDFDNLFKCMYDALQHARVFEDDNQIRSGVYDEGPIVKGGEVEISLEELGPAPPLQVDLNLPVPEEEPPF